MVHKWCHTPALLRPSASFSFSLLPVWEVTAPLDDGYLQERMISQRKRKKNLYLANFLPLHTYTHLLSSLQMPIMLWNMGPEKQTRSLTVSPLGKPNFKGLCWGVKQRRASACIPYLSSVHVGLSNHCCFCSHQITWSDQSFLISTAQHRTLHKVPSVLQVS